MSTRPTPRASSLAGMTPSRPAQLAPDSPHQPTTQQHPHSPQEPPTHSQGAGSGGRARQGLTSGQEPQEERAGEEAKKKDGFYITPSDKKRAVRAQKAASLYVEDTEINSWTAYVEYAVMKLTKDLERRYNDSKPF